eukprot:gene9755-10789_t
MKAVGASVLLALLCLLAETLAFFSSPPMRARPLCKATTESEPSEPEVPSAPLASKASVRIQDFFHPPPWQATGQGNVIDEINLRGRALLEQAPVPHAKAEAWRHINVNRLFKPRPPIAVQVPGEAVEEELLAFVDKSCSDRLLVFLDGHYAPHLSRTSGLPAGVCVRVLQGMAQRGQLQQEEEEVLDKVLQLKDSKEEPRDSYGSDALMALNLDGLQALLREVVVVDVGEGVQAGALQIVQMTSSGIAAFPHLLVMARERSQLTLLQTVASRPSSSSSSEDGGYHGGVARVVVGPHATIQHTYVQEVSERMRHSDVITADVGPDARYDNFLVSMGGDVSRVNLHVDLLARMSNTSVSTAMTFYDYLANSFSLFQLSGVVMSSTNQSLDLHTSISHLNASTHTVQNQRMVLGSRAEACFKGRVRMPAISEDASAEQNCRSLLLGQRVKLHVMPTLEISSDQVSCSHGAAVSDLDENSLFFLGSRGINRLEARKLLMRSFPLEVLHGALINGTLEARIMDKVAKIGQQDQEVRNALAPMMSL